MLHKKPEKVPRAKKDRFYSLVQFFIAASLEGTKGHRLQVTLLFLSGITRCTVCQFCLGNRNSFPSEDNRKVSRTCLYTVAGAGKVSRFLHSRTSSRLVLWLPRLNRRKKETLELTLYSYISFIQTYPAHVCKLRLAGFRAVPLSSANTAVAQDALWSVSYPR